MAERVDIPAPPIQLGAVEDTASLREWARKTAQAVRSILSERPTGKMIADTPTQISGNQNNYAHGQVDVLRLDATAGPHTISGFDAQGFRDFWVLNVGSNAFSLGHQDANSDAENRILSRTGASVSVAADGSVRLWYDEGTSRWRILGE